MTQQIPSYLDTCEPEARIEPVGRWTYRVWISHGLITYGPSGYGWHKLGRDRAERKAKRKLARYRRQEARREAGWTVR